MLHQRNAKNALQSINVRPFTNTNHKTGPDILVTVRKRILCNTDRKIVYTYHVHGQRRKVLLTLYDVSHGKVEGPESVLIGCAAHLRSPPSIVAIYVTKTYLLTMKRGTSGSAIAVACLILTTVLVTMGLC